MDLEDARGSLVVIDRADSVQEFNMKTAGVSCPLASIARRQT